MTEEIKTVQEVNNTDTETEKAPVDPERVVPFEEALEAILFAAGHPISYATIARVLNLTPAKVKDMVFEYSLKYNDCQIPRGVILLTFPDSCQLCTKQYYLPEIRDALGIRKSGSLSTSSMETLAIIAYNQPVTRVFVDTLRRVDSSYAMTNLLDRGLIESKGRMDAPGRPMLYGTTQDFLRCFGLSDLSGLPGTTEELMEVFDRAKISTDNTDAQTEDVDSVDENEIATAAPQIAMDFDGQTTENEISENELDEPSADDDVNNEDI